ncbi:MAG: ABC transporter permease [Armatimonadetes bacterium]|nr:ABC transporter permease [Armatimonadota bacterium]
MKRSLREQIERLTDRREFMLVYLIVLGGIALSFAKPEFLSRETFSAVLLSVADQSIIAVGMTILLVAGAFDLSVGSTLALTGLVAAVFAGKGYPAGVAVLMALGTGTLIGVTNGLIITELGINPFITTLGTMSLLRGLVLVISGGQNVSGLPESFTVLGQGRLLGVQAPIWVALAVVGLGHWLLSQTRFFRQSYYIGGNEKAAVLSGIDVKRMTVFHFALVGFLAALAGVVVTARHGTASTTAGQGLELKVIAAVILGGASLKGGEGTVFGAFLGTLMMAVIISSINLLGVDLNWVDCVLGAALLLAVAADMLSRGELR